MQHTQVSRVNHILNDCKANFIIVDDKDILDFTVNGFETQFINVNHINDNETFFEENLSLETIAFLQYTSGSTGSPKGVIVNHNNLISNFNMMKTGVSLDNNSIIVSWLPFFHDMGLIGSVLLTAYCDATLYFMTPVKFIREPFSWLEVISKYAGTHAYAPNFAYELLINQANNREDLEFNLASWKVALSGAEPVRFNTLQKFADIFKKYHFNPKSFYPAYGMAEATLYITGSQVQQGFKYETIDTKELESGKGTIAAQEDSTATINLVNCGLPRLDSELYIVNPDSKAIVIPRNIGEIWVKGPHVCSGYWGKTALTEECFLAYTADKKVGPCLRTGDMGYLNEQGELFVTGRMKDLIIIRGRNLYPQDIEASVEEVSDLIKPNSVIAFSIDTLQEEKLIIVIEIRHNDDIAIFTTLEKNIRKKILVEYDVLIAEIIFGARGSVPRTTSSKLQRQLCKKNYLKGSLPQII